VVRAYLETDLGRTSERHWEDPATAPGDDEVRLRSIRAIPAKGGRADEVDVTEPVDIEIEYWSAGNLRPAVNFHLFNSEGICLFAVTDFVSAGWRKIPTRAGVIRSTCRIPGNFLAEGRMTVNVAIDTFNPYVGRAGEVDAIAFQVADRTAGDGVRGVYTGEWPGVLRPRLDWTVEWLPESGGR
jgi:lipopolysaccharide transport system ATP-binding protein